VLHSPSGLPADESSHSLPPVETEQAKGRIWNGYVCPGCRNVFRVAADFAGDEVMCPSCKETLRLPKKPDEIPPLSAPLQLTPPAPAAPAEEDPTRGAVDAPAWRTLFSTPGGRKKLALALGLPLLLVAVVLMFLPAEKTPNAGKSSATPPAIGTESPAAPLPETDASQIADLIPKGSEIVPPPEPPPPALPGQADPAQLAEASKEAKANGPLVEVPTPIDPEHGLVQAVPANPPVEPPPVAPDGTDEPAVMIHTVTRGDTLTKISDTYRVPIDVIRQANQLKNDTVRLGQQLRIPGAAPQPSAPPPVAENTSPPPTRHHTVVRGDTLTSIARKYAVDPKAIIRANGMKNEVVRLGAKLVIPPADP
jgi:LysM repeat protein